MILGIGIDLVDCRRLERPLDISKERFLKRIMTDFEIDALEKKLATMDKFLTEQSRKEHMLMGIAKVFAAKEAFVKALGTGFRDGIVMNDLEVHRNEFGKPLLKVGGKAYQALENSLPIGMEARIHLSLSDEFPYAQAQVIIDIY